MTSRLPGDVSLHLLKSIYHNGRHSSLRLATRRRSPALLSLPGGSFLPSFSPSSSSSSSSSARHLGSLSRSKAHLGPSIGHGALRRRSGAASNDQTQSYATDSTNRTSPTKNAKPREIAVLGAGVTGLTTAHYLARYAKDAHITIYEASHGPGGWIKADRVEVKGEDGRRGHVLFQYGPRVLRSNRSSIKHDDLVLFDVLASLKLSGKIRHPRAVSEDRYVYYPDHLVKMPSPDPRSWALADMVRSYLTEPIWSGSVWAAFNFLAHYRGFFARHESQDQSGFPREAGRDESVAEFLTSILGDDEIVNNIVSAMMHGIYGGDINKLSAKHTMLETLWYRFQRPPPAAGRTWVDLDNLKVMYDMMHSPNRLKIIELAEGAINWKLLAFEDGLVSLVSGLEKDLKSRSNVTFKYGEPVTSLKHEKHKILVTTPGTERPIKYDHVISTLFSKQLARIAEPKNSLPSLEKTHAVTIMVVNLWYPNPNLLAQGGFGYLIPSTALNNHEGALGVLFDSELRTNDSEIPGTKLTVMLGGHHWDGWKYFPSEEVGIAMAKEVVKRQLGISDTENVVARARLCPNCLPQHFVGHRERMRDAHYEIMSAFQGHLTVAGPSYTSVGVIPAMRAGFDAGMRVARGHAQPWFPFTTSIDSEQSLNYDYWGGAKEGEVPDLLGASGLLRFTANEWDSVRPVSRSELLFRTFTAKDLRFRDEFGNFLDVDRRMLKNAPPGVWNGHKNQHTKSTESGD